MILSRILILCSILTFLFSQNTLSIANVDTSTGTLDVYMENTDPVGGFQFALVGIDITGASGGSAQTQDLQFQTVKQQFLDFHLLALLFLKGRVL